MTLKFLLDTRFSVDQNVPKDCFKQESVDTLFDILIKTGFFYNIWKEKDVPLLPYQFCGRNTFPGGGVLSPKSYVDVPAGPRKSDYLYSNFLPNFPPISIPFSKEKHPILIKLGAFYNNLPKIHTI